MKRLLTVLLLSALFAVNAHAQSANFVPVTPNRPASGFSCGLTNIAATLTAFACTPVPASTTVSYYITDIIVQTTTGTAGTFAIQSGTGANCAGTTTAVFPASGSGADRWTAPINSSPTSVIQFSVPIKVTAGQGVCFIGVATNTGNVQINGYSQ